jgi:hypothetical protein
MDSMSEVTKCDSQFGGKVFGVKCEKEAGHDGLHSGGGTAWVIKVKVTAKNK